MYEIDILKVVDTKMCHFECFKLNLWDTCLASERKTKRSPVASVERSLFLSYITVPVKHPRLPGDPNSPAVIVLL